MGCFFVSNDENKRLTAGLLLAKHEGLFRCPLCTSRMRVAEGKSLVCAGGHCFDIAKRGYVNLLTHALTTKYDKRLFESRAAINDGGFFEPLNRQIGQWMMRLLGAESEPVHILDAGCGEGSVLSAVVGKLSRETGGEFVSVGADLAKEGIAIAARKYPGSVWCVADLAKSPFAGKRFDFILNVLAPAGYAEFDRLLKDDGIVIKVIPESGYLQELREVWYEETDKHVYSNRNTLERFREHFDLVDRQRVHYRVAVNDSLIEPLVRMTPLSWGVGEKRLHKALGMKLTEITVDLSMVIGKKKSRG